MTNRERIDAIDKASARAMRVAFARGAVYQCDQWWAAPGSPAARAASRRVNLLNAAFRRRCYRSL